MRETIRELNKRTLSDNTGVSYDKLRKYAAGVIQNLTNEEIGLIYNYLTKAAEKFKI